MKNTRMFPQPRSAAMALSVLLLLGGHRILAAQAAPPPEDSVARVVQVAPVEELRRVATQADADEQAARRVAAQARQDQQRIQSLIDIQKSEIKTLSKRVDLAKKEKRKTDQQALELERSGHDARLKLLERWQDVYNATSAAADARRNLAQEQRRLSEAEQQHSQLQTGMPAVAQPDSAVRAFEFSRYEENLIQQSRRVLEARRREAEARQQLAQRERDLADRQLSLIEAQLALRAVKH